ncbi:peptide deformylase [Paenarthrobacter sp. DKR-5]|uniref:peptide deformylase n=1 Tax=Paenarthrobacter sp. DKR-5 TaxID=2835535 RepID=UPI001BDD7044|nr:peptide deformylase [Paenarthrobacter sp. DKR-5]MBT1002057.1 peptide deformylase [Paenarthrobacter sp. DKR-5]
MAILGIRIIGDPVLRTRSEPVTEFGPELAKLVADMEETMLDVDGAGLAAPQVGVNLRVFTFYVDGKVGHVVNPVLETGDEPQEGSEGCLSVPGLGFPTPRSKWARVSGQDKDGNPVVIEGEGLLARALQHETDHLDGTLYINRLVGDERAAAMKAIRNAKYGQVAERTTSERARTVGSSFGTGSSFGGTA